MTIEVLIRQVIKNLTERAERYRNDSMQIAPLMAEALKISKGTVDPKEIKAELNRVLR